MPCGAGYAGDNGVKVAGWHPVISVNCGRTYDEIKAIEGGFLYSL